MFQLPAFWTFQVKTPPIRYRVVGQEVGNNRIEDFIMTKHPGCDLVRPIRSMFDSFATMLEGLRHRFSLETINLSNFGEGSVYDRCFQDYRRILDANNYEELTRRPINENTPLLDHSGGSSSGGNSNGGTNVLSKIGSTVNTALPVGKAGLIATGATLATGLGIGIKKLVDRTDKKGYVLPHSEFIGPDNPAQTK
ncbi:hypothetical protein NPIL_31581 [Nephila pilipes]|uniref:Uncharacterized protein n=1 Tax=Nephila pilipes TaxID=299642 RepID=A0A8X6QDD0_NEPPI|nr:hypothetical protein NPIL_31581 [Nephila pilipes]